MELHSKAAIGGGAAVAASEREEGPGAASTQWRRYDPPARVRVLKRSSSALIDEDDVLMQNEGSFKPMSSLETGGNGGGAAAAPLEQLDLVDLTDVPLSQMSKMPARRSGVGESKVSVVVEEGEGSSSTSGSQKETELIALLDDDPEESLTTTPEAPATYESLSAVVNRLELNLDVSQRRVRAARAALERAQRRVNTIEAEAWVGIEAPIRVCQTCIDLGCALCGLTATQTQSSSQLSSQPTLDDGGNGKSHGSGGVNDVHAESKPAAPREGKAAVACVVCGQPDVAGRDGWQTGVEEMWRRPQFEAGKVVTHAQKALQREESKLEKIRAKTASTRERLEKKREEEEAALLKALQDAEDMAQAAARAKEEASERLLRLGSRKLLRTSKDGEGCDGERGTCAMWFNKMCVVCEDAPRDTAFLGCGHVVCCQLDAAGVKECPACRRLVEGTLHLFFS